jgi:hypothetical protein
MMKRIGLLIGLAMISMGVARQPALDVPQPRCLPCCPDQNGNLVQC